MAQLRDTVVSGSLRATDSLLSTTAQFQILNVPTASNGTTFGPGTNGHVLISNGTSVYWGTTTAITQVGTITSGTWQGTTIGTAYGGTGNNTGFTQWGIIYANPATKLISTAAGTSGYLLQGNGSAAPSWIQATNANTASTIVKRDADCNFSAGTITASLSGNADTATALTSNAGDGEQPIYFTGGKPSATTYALKATINNGDAGYVAYYSAARAISSSKASNGMLMPAHYFHNLYNNNPTTGTTVYVHYYNLDTTSTNTFANLRVKSGSSYKVLAFGGDGELTWNGTMTANGGYLKSTLNSNTVTIGSQNASFCHIYNSADISFIFNKSVLTTAGSLGNTTYPWNNLYIGKGDGAGIYYTTNNYTACAIKFLNHSADQYGIGIKIGGGGVTIIGAGESTDTIVSNVAPASGAETMYITSDNNIEFYPAQNSYDAAAHHTINASGFWAGINGNTTREIDVGVRSGAGTMYMYSVASTSGDRGIWVPAHGTGSGKNVFAVDTNNNCTFYGNCTGSAGSVAWANTGHPSTFPPSSHTHPVSELTWGAGVNLSCTGDNSEWSIDMNGTGSYWHVWSATQSCSCIRCYNADAHVEIPRVIDVGLNKNGSLIIGNTGGTNLAFDDNEIMARNNSAASTLYINSEGGLVYIGSGGLEVTGDIKPGSGKRIGGSGGQLYIGNSDNAGWVYLQDAAAAAGSGKWKIYSSSGEATFTKCYGAVWNDYAEMRNVPEAQTNIIFIKNDKGDISERNYPNAGRCVSEIGNGSMSITTARLQKGCKIISDTFGFCIGETDDSKTPIAVTGRVLAYPLESLEECTKHIGDFVCSGPNGTISIMTQAEAINHPECIIGTISEIPTYDTWKCGNNETKPIKVKGRIWIYVR